MKEILSIAFIVLSLGILVNSWITKHTESKKEMEIRNKNTRELFLDTLERIGCQYQLGEGEDTRIFFSYQGEHFFADMKEDSIYVHIWDTHWVQVELYDIDEVSRLRKAINTSNMNSAVTTFYTIDDDAKTMNVHTKSTITFICNIPYLENYLRTELDEFFHAHQIVCTEIHKLREQEQHA